MRGSLVIAVCLLILASPVLLFPFLWPAVNATMGPLVNSETRIDRETGMTWLVQQGQGSRSDLRWICPQKTAVVVMDVGGSFADVTAKGALQVSETGGLPIYGLEAEGAAAYEEVLVSHRWCSHLFVSVEAGDAILSLDGGMTDHFRVSAAVALTLSGLDIPAGVAIKAKNATAVNYDSLAVSVW